MARADLLVSLVKASAEGDLGRVRKTTEAIIAEERAKNHHVLADRLTRAVANGEASPRAAFVGRGRAWRRFATELVPRRRLEDLVLSDANRAACRDLIEEQRRASVLRAHSLEPRHRVLLVGPPGNGKTTLAEAIAEALSVPFIVVRYETMIGSYLGETANRLKRVIDYARTNPGVLFFDEFDAVAKERGDSHETGEIKRVVTSLLMQVDGLPSYTVTVAATNHPELLDRAVWRRFQLRLSLGAPTERDLARYLEKFGHSMGGGLGHAPASLAARLGPVSYAEAEEFCLDVRRRFALGTGRTSMKAVATATLKLWEERKRVVAEAGRQHRAGSSRPPHPAVRCRCFVSASSHGVGPGNGQREEGRRCR